MAIQINNIQMTGSGASVFGSNITTPGAPTIGTATRYGSLGTQVSVSFTGTSDAGGATILYYEVTSSPGNITATGTVSPIIVSGLTQGTSYTFTVRAVNVLGAGAASAASNSVTPDINAGAAAFTSAGSTTWVVPVGVSSISVVCIGGGGGGAALRVPATGGYRSGGGGGGGALVYLNNISVTAGETYTVVVGSGGIGGAAGSSFGTGNTGGNSYISTFVGNSLITGARGGGGGTWIGATGYAGVMAGASYDGLGGGGAGGNGQANTSNLMSGGAGGGGAGGYNDYGGDGATFSAGAWTNPTSGANGGGGGGSYSRTGTVFGGGGGGGTGINGQGTNGTAGNAGSSDGGGGGGSGGSNGTNDGALTGGSYGGGGGGARSASIAGGDGAGGAVRIVWGNSTVTKSFPSTNVG